ncbi:MAG TPA: hypothetical protein VMS29_05860, partial [Pyrinomonadaceae bacterium]|nr:hypothetical protein [Pyrinomonadaceae bacterium]
LKRGVIIGAKSAVFPNKVIPAGFWCGIPAQPIEEYKRNTAALRRLDRLREDVSTLKKNG